MEGDTRRWVLGLIYILAVATIWIAASYIVQSVVDSGVSPFLITYICNSLFVVYIPIVEISRYVEDSNEKIFSWFKGKNNSDMQLSADLENVNLLVEGDHNTHPPVVSPTGMEIMSGAVSRSQDSDSTFHSQSGIIFDQEPIMAIDDCTGLYAVYVTLIRTKLPDEKKGEGQASTAQFLGFATHLTTTTVATAGLTIQVPIAAVVDTLTGHAPHLMDYIGAVAVMIGFAGINIPSDDSPGAQAIPKEVTSIGVDDGHLELASDGGTIDAR
ncbi:hypothetical protein BHM03_00062334 [Ensete ventricosum]|nr:hypothetical protein BHM03_00062334 [Ensete ventricosum]